MGPCFLTNSEQVIRNCRAGVQRLKQQRSCRKSRHLSGSAAEADNSYSQDQHTHTRGPFQRREKRIGGAGQQTGPRHLQEHRTIRSKIRPMCVKHELFFKRPQNQKLTTFESFASWLCACCILRVARMTPQKALACPVLICRPKRNKIVKDDFWHSLVRSLCMSPARCSCPDITPECSTLNRSTLCHPHAESWPTLTQFTLTELQLHNKRLSSKSPTGTNNTEVNKDHLCGVCGSTKPVKVPGFFFLRRQSTQH